MRDPFRIRDVVSRGPQVIIIFTSTWIVGHDLSVLPSIVIPSSTTMRLPSAQKAIVVTAPQEAELLPDHPIPTLQDQHLLIKVVCVALNPADWRHIDFYSAPGALLGFDYSGIVAETGPGITRFAPGDRICGATHGGCTKTAPLPNISW